MSVGGVVAHSVIASFGTLAGPTEHLAFGSLADQLKTMRPHFQSPAWLRESLEQLTTHDRIGRNTSSALLRRAVGNVFCSVQTNVMYFVAED